MGFRVWGLGPRLSLEDNLSSWRTATRFLLLHPKPETFNGTEKKDAPPGCEFTVLDWEGKNTETGLAKCDRLQLATGGSCSKARVPTAMGKPDLQPEAEALGPPTYQLLGYFA